MRRHLPLLLALVTPGVAMAQAVVQPLPGSTDADLLAATMRRVVANPLDLDALLTAGEQSLRVDDNAGAASLFARAEKIDPRNGRVKAGMAAILVRSERPGEALRFFQQAEAAGLDPRRYAADRGLAFDLVGEQARAQRDYRLALAAGPDDETTRRLALSLGISGQRDQALKLLDPLLGRTDRGAWRARAFILAMTGDQDGAAKIAGTMMPGVAAGLRPFFQRLPSLSPTDRAFAVHFGEVRATPERIADARLIPQFPALAPETRPVQVAAIRTAAPQPTRAQSRRQEREARRRRGRDEGRVTLASAATGLPATAAVVAPPTARPLQVATLLPTGAAPVPVTAPTRAPVGLTTQVPSRDANVVPASTGGLAALIPSTPGAPVVRPVEAASLPAANPTPPAQTASVTLASTTPVSTAPLSTAAVSTAPISAPISTPIPAPIVTSAAPTTLAAVPGGTATPPRTAPAVEAAMPRPAADSVLARIVASLVIPASELGVEGPTRAADTSSTEGATRTVEAVRTKAARDAEAGEVAERLSGVPAKPPVTLTRAERRAAAEKKAAELKAAADKKAAAAKLAEEKRVARTNPQRIWVQVAGGAYAGDLPKAYAAVKKKAPDVFGARAGYSAKLRATNRVLTGPFKTDAEARAFVNQLARAGVSAFPFTSDPGEAVTKLPAR